MPSNEFELAELPDGICVVSVVTPAADGDPNHVFEVRRGTQLIAQFDSLRAVAEMLRGLDPTQPDQ